jgi:hypothetical protein
MDIARPTFARLAQPQRFLARRLAAIAYPPWFREMTAIACGELIGAPDWSIADRS